MSPGPLRQLDVTTFTVLLHDPHNAPINKAQVSVDLTMPSMNMPKNTVQTHPEGPGTYQGTGRFTMAGSWRVTVMATHDKKIIAKSFTINVR